MSMSTAELIKARAVSRKALLVELETIIQRGIESFIDVGNALLKIRNKQLYQEKGYATFEQYCQQEWHLKRAHAYRQIAAYEVARLSPIGGKPRNEAQARELVGLSADQVRSVAQIAPLATSAAKQIKAAVEQITGKTDMVETITVRDLKDTILGQIRDYVMSRAARWPAGESKAELYINLVVLGDEINPEGNEDPNPKATSEVYRELAEALKAEPDLQESRA